MKIKCPKCGYVMEIEGNLKQYKGTRTHSPVFMDCQSCNYGYAIIDNICYEAPTGGTGEVDPDKPFIPEMSLRDYFAGQALAKLAGENLGNARSSAEVISFYCYEHADAMIKERGK